MKKQLYFMSIVAIALIVGGVFLYMNRSDVSPVACTLDAKICSDDSTVGREGPDCEFAKCPNEIDDTHRDDNNETINCVPEQRSIDACTADYTPVCATVAIQCIKAPCEPIQETFSNACNACRNSLVKSYVVGECLDDQR
ncbi:hypothetical protein KKH05_01790 [Patescibacteria group bacterium]|nr:hypothetical protein [Patescibacteria group bacterium]